MHAWMRHYGIGVLGRGPASPAPNTQLAGRACLRRPLGTKLPIDKRVLSTFACFKGQRITDVGLIKTCFTNLTIREYIHGSARSNVNLCSFKFASTIYNGENIFRKIPFACKGESAWIKYLNEEWRDENTKLPDTQRSELWSDRIKMQNFLFHFCWSMFTIHPFSRTLCMNMHWNCMHSQCNPNICGPWANP